MAFISSVFGWLFAKIRNRRYAIQNNIGKDLIFGSIYKMALYQNWKKDPAPMIYVMYSGPMTFIKTSGHYTDGINLNYLDAAEKMWLAQMIFLMRKGNQQMNGAIFYRYLKTQKPNIVKKAYRRYHTSMINNPKMVSAGSTSLDKLVYPYNDPFIQRLNERISPTGLSNTSIQVAYSSTELRDRIIQAQNSVPLQTVRQNQPQLAPWVKRV
jgi:hypothetical protein